LVGRHGSRDALGDPGSHYRHRTGNACMLALCAWSNNATHTPHQLHDMHASAGNSGRHPLPEVHNRSNLA
jgi:hypothetical protein